MRISWQRVKPGMWLEFERRYREFSHSQLQNTDPKARWLLRDLDDRDAGYTVSIWNSDAAMKDYPTAAIRAQIAAQFSGLLIGDPDRPHSFEVRSELP